jgi:hypothetical protein
MSIVRKLRPSFLGATTAAPTFLPEGPQGRKVSPCIVMFARAVGAILSGNHPLRMKTVCNTREALFSVLLRLSFLAPREDFSSCRQYLRVLRGQQSLNTEVAEMLRALGVTA